MKIRSDKEIELLLPCDYPCFASSVSSSPRASILSIQPSLSIRFHSDGFQHMRHTSVIRLSPGTFPTSMAVCDPKNFPPRTTGRAPRNQVSPRPDTRIAVSRQLRMRPVTTSDPSTPWPRAAKGITQEQVGMVRARAHESLPITIARSVTHRMTPTRARSNRVAGCESTGHSIQF